MQNIRNERTGNHIKNGNIIEMQWNSLEVYKPTFCVTQKMRSERTGNHTGKGTCNNTWSFSYTKASPIRISSRAIAVLSTFSLPNF